MVIVLLFFICCSLGAPVTRIDFWYPSTGSCNSSPLISILSPTPPTQACHDACAAIGSTQVRMSCPTSPPPADSGYMLMTVFADTGCSKWNGDSRARPNVCINMDTFASLMQGGGGTRATDSFVSSVVRHVFSRAPTTLTSPGSLLPYCASTGKAGVRIFSDKACVTEMGTIEAPQDTCTAASSVLQGLAAGDAAFIMSCPKGSSGGGGGQSSDPWISGVDNRIVIGVVVTLVVVAAVAGAVGGYILWKRRRSAQQNNNIPHVIVNDEHMGLGDDFDEDF